jgi:AcrR family transcriptional regulator
MSRLVNTRKTTPPAPAPQAPDEIPAARLSEPAEPGRQVRGERLIEKVLEATLEELSRVGYSALSVETVAERAGVNKTTVYRRWPTKADLVGAAMMKEADATFCTQDTGAVRTDMIAMLREFRDLLHTRRGQSIVRMIFAEGLTSEVATIVDTVRKAKEKDPKRVVARAIARGELPKGTDVDLVFSTLIGSLQHFFFFLHETPTDRRIEQIVDLVLEGARHGGGRRLRRAK